MKTMKALAAAILALCTVAACAERAAVNQTPRDVAQQSEREISGVWENLSKGLDALRSARRTSEITNFFLVARASTNSLARVADRIDLFQNRLTAVITNEIDHQPIEKTVRQELRGYVENDLQILQGVKAIASEDMDAISEMIAKREREWGAMADVLARLYPESQCMEIMQRRFTATADDLRAKIESHRGVASSETAAAAEPPPQQTSEAPRENVSRSVSDPAPEPAAYPPARTVISTRDDNAPSRGNWNEADQMYLSLSAAARHIAVMASIGSKESELRNAAMKTGPFLLSADQIVFLKTSGISDDVIQAMLKRDRALRRR